MSAGLDVATSPSSATRGGPPGRRSRQPQGSLKRVPSRMKSPIFVQKRGFGPREAMRRASRPDARLRLILSMLYRPADRGEVPEWSIGTVSKTVVRASVP